MKSFFLAVIFLAGLTTSKAQTTLTLKQAIELGIKNNFDVMQADLLMQKAGVVLQQTKENRLPNLNANLTQGTNYGKSINPFTNTYIDQKVGFGSYGASSNILLFNGFALQNAVKSNKLGYEASEMELQQARDNLTINVILAYLQILSSQDVLVQSQEQVSVTQKQVERLSILNQTGAILPSDYYDLKGQVANEQIAVVTNKTNLETAKLSLAQLLNIAYNKDLELERIPENNFNINYSETPDSIYNTALQQFAQIKAVKLRTESAEKNIRSLKGQLFPTLSFGGNINTNYSSVATSNYFVNSTEIPSSNYVTVDGIQYPVIEKQDNYNSQKINFGSQLNNNLYYTINLGLTIPLFNAFRVRNQIRMAKIDFKNSELTEQHAKTQLQQLIEQAYINLTSASEKYKLLQDQVQSFGESFQKTEVRFNSGVINSVDYLIAKNNLNLSQNNLIIAKYDFLLREKILDYYRGKLSW